MKQDLSISQLMTAVTQLAKLKKDYLVPTHELKVSSKGDTTFLDVVGTPYVLQPRAAAQLSSIARIPYSYFSRLQQSYPDLLDMNLNRLLADQDKPRMVRTLGSVARAVLSDRYRKVEHLYYYDLPKGSANRTHSKEELADIKIRKKTWPENDPYKYKDIHIFKSYKSFIKTYPQYEHKLTELKQLKALRNHDRKKCK